MCHHSAGRSSEGDAGFWSRRAGASRKGVSQNSFPCPRCPLILTSYCLLLTSYDEAPYWRQCRHYFRQREGENREGDPCLTRDQSSCGGRGEYADPSPEKDAAAPRTDCPLRSEYSCE